MSVGTTPTLRDGWIAVPGGAHPGSMQSGVDATALDEVGVGSLLHQATGIEHEHQIGELGGRQSVGDAHDRATFRETGERDRQGLFGLGVDGTRRLVEHQDAGFGELCPSQGHELSFARPLGP